MGKRLICEAHTTRKSDWDLRIFLSRRSDQLADQRVWGCCEIRTSSPHVPTSLIKSHRLVYLEHSLVEQL